MKSMKLKNIIVKGVLFISVAAAMWSCYDITDTQRNGLIKEKRSMLERSTPCMSVPE